MIYDIKLNSEHMIYCEEVPQKMMRSCEVNLVILSFWCIYLHRRSR